MKLMNTYTPKLPLAIMISTTLLNSDLCASYRRYWYKRVTAKNDPYHDV